MNAPAAPRPFSHRLAVYSYLRPLVEGGRVLEIGCGQGEGAAHLAGLGARVVVGAEEDPATLQLARGQHRQAGLSFVGDLSTSALREGGPYDLILLPDAGAVLRGAARLTLGTLRGLLRPSGRLCCLVPSGDGGGAGGLGYYEVVDALSPHFPRVRMFGQTAFAAYGLAEFDDVPAGLRVDSGLVAESAEQPGHYLAVAGPDQPLAFGYALVQVPVAALVGAPPAAASASGALSGGVELQRRLTELQAQLEVAQRAARVQTEEADELRARLRRGADDRAGLDQEVLRLRKALTESDDSVLSLARRTTEQMTALAQRLTAGLRPAEPTVPSPALAEKLHRQEAALAARESALAERDERVAALEAERQDLIWRLEAAEEELRSRPLVAAAPPPAPARNAPPRQDDDIDVRIDSDDDEAELRALLAAREQALDEYRRAAAAHIEEVAHLRDALTEQSAAVAELEESLGTAEARLATAEQESRQLRRQTAESEDADRQRRSRLAEVEGTLLRLKSQAAAPRPDSNGHWEEETRRLQARLGDVERTRAEAERRLIEASTRLEQLSVAQDEVRSSNEARWAAESSQLQVRLTDAERTRDEAERRFTEASARLEQLTAAEGERRGASPGGQWDAEASTLQARLTDAERTRDEAERRLTEASARLDSLERVAAEKDELAHTEEALRARISELEARADGTGVNRAQVEVERLRAALERSEEQLWDARAQLSADRERINLLERGPRPAPNLLDGVRDDLASIENHLRVELGHLAAVERALVEWRSSLGKDNPGQEAAPNGEG